MNLAPTDTVEFEMGQTNLLFLHLLLLFSFTGGGGLVNVPLIRSPIMDQHGVTSPELGSQTSRNEDASIHVQRGVAAPRGACTTTLQHQVGLAAASALAEAAPLRRPARAHGAPRGKRAGGQGRAGGGRGGGRGRRSHKLTHSGGNQRGTFGATKQIRSAKQVQDMSSGEHAIPSHFEIPRLNLVDVKGPADITQVRNRGGLGVL